MTRISLLLISLTLAGATQARSATGGHDHHPATVAAASVDDAAKPAVAVVEQFGKSLSAADFATVEKLLDPDVVILESGGAERSRAEYLGHHAIADAQFLRGAHIQVTNRSAHADGNLAWVATESDLHASADGKPMTLLSTETIVLRRVEGKWRIVHIHWSSRKKT